MEKEYIKLADGREVRRGPYIDQGGFLSIEGKFRVGIYALDPAMLLYRGGEKWGDSITILEVKIPANYHSVKLPDVNILEKGLWTKDLTTEVIRVLRQSDKDKKAIGYVIAKLTGKEKELILGDGRRLVGDLEFSLHSNSDTFVHDDLTVFGNIKDQKMGEMEKTTLFTIKYLYPFFWPGSDKRPTWTKNREVWCKKLEFVVINYLHLLVDFADAPLNKQISEIARDLADKSEWAVTCHSIFQKLIGLSSKVREDDRIKQAVELIEEVSHI